ncbi:MAG: hypothetical protein ACTS6G_01875, partial [Candidatus Hodgkinia cicadicola]
MPPFGRRHLRFAVVGHYEMVLVVCFPSLVNVGQVLKNGNLSFGKWESRFPFKLKPFGGEADWAKDCFDVLSAQR